MNTKLEALAGRCTCGHRTHRVLLRPDGTIETPDHPDAAAEGRRLAAFARLGRPVPDEAGCVGLVAMLCGAEVVAPYLESSSPSAIGQPVRVGDIPVAWDKILKRYGGHALVRRALTIADTQTVDPETARAFMAAVAQCSWYEGQRMKLTCGLEPERVAAWGHVGYSAHDVWTVPVQKHWLDIDRNGLSVIADKVIVGQAVEDPRVMYAVTSITGEFGGWSFCVRPFRYESHLLRLTDLLDLAPTPAPRTGSR